MAFWKYLVLVAAGLFLRSTISLHSYSGQNKPTMFGDFEAQRHWQEITVNLPIKDWYENTTDNDLLYWGLDYPPLTAYHSYLVGKFAGFLDPSYVELHKSRGISTDEHKMFMRWTVIVADLLIYIPAVILACNAVFYNVLKQNIQKVHLLYLLVALMYPGQILIDNGHFQYNNVSLGFAALAIAALLKDRRIVGAFFFVLALNYKQMELYHAVPFFCYLLSNSFTESDNEKRHSFLGGIFRLLTLGISVIVTFLIIWLPWLNSTESFLQVVHRIFPIYRGVFEDKVANVWCIVNVFMKIKENFTNEEMAKLCLMCTATAIIPSSISLLFRPRKRQFLYALINSSFAFFLFSFQVHEKSILLVALPVTLIFPFEPFMAVWFLQISTFSMLPLLVKDGLTSAFIGLSGAFILLIKMAVDNLKSEKHQSMNFVSILWNLNKNRKRNDGKLMEKFMIFCYVVSTLGQALLTAAYFFVEPPANLPFLHPLLVSAYSCCHFLFFFLYFNVKQEVEDQSDGCGGKFSAVIVSEQFNGKSLLQRHRLVNTALQEELKTIHAFTQKTFTPEQWKDQQN